MNESRRAILALAAAAIGSMACATAMAQATDFKRHSFAQGVDQVVALPTDRTFEESTNEILAGTGRLARQARLVSQVSGRAARGRLPLMNESDPHSCMGASRPA
jgi:hypothetical protein